MAKRAVDEYSSLISNSFLEMKLFYEDLAKFNEILSDAQKNFNLALKIKDMVARRQLFKALQQKVSKIKVYLVHKQKNMSNLEARLAKYLDNNHYKRAEYFFELNTYKTQMDNFEREVNGFLLDCEISINNIEDEIFKDRNFGL